MRCEVCGVKSEGPGIFTRKNFSPGPYWEMRAPNPPAADARGRRQSGRFGSLMITSGFGIRVSLRIAGTHLVMTSVRHVA